jgi:hypothetical protein
MTLQVIIEGVVTAIEVLGLIVFFEAAVGCDVLLALPGCATLSSCSFK